MKTTIKLLLASIIVIAINGIFFEYCVNRESSAILSVIALVAVILIDFISFVALVKKVTEILNLNK